MPAGGADARTKQESTSAIFHLITSTRSHPREEQPIKQLCDSGAVPILSAILTAKGENTLAAAAYAAGDLHYMCQVAAIGASWRHQTPSPSATSGPKPSPNPDPDLQPRPQPQPQPRPRPQPQPLPRPHPRPQPQGDDGAATALSRDRPTLLRVIELARGGGTANPLHKASLNAKPSQHSASCSSSSSSSASSSASSSTASSSASSSASSTPPDARALALALLGGLLQHTGEDALLLIIADAGALDLVRGMHDMLGHLLRTDWNELDQDGSRLDRT